MTRQVDTSTLERAVRLLSEYANSGVPDAVSLECAQVCGKLRTALAQPQPSPSAGEVLTQLSAYTSEPTGLVAMIARSVLGYSNDAPLLLLESEWREVADSPEAAQLRALAQPQPSPSVSDVLRLLADEIQAECDTALELARTGGDLRAPELRRLDALRNRLSQQRRALDPARLRALAAPQAHAEAQP